MRGIRLFAVLAIAALLGSALVYPVVAHALSALCAPGASATCAPTPTPIPTPSVPTAVATIAMTSPQTITGGQAGDVVLICSTGGTQFPANVTNSFSIISGNQFTAGAFGNCWVQTLNAQSPTSISVPTLTASATAVCLVDYRWLVPITDGTTAVATGTSTSPAGTTFTNTVNNGLVFAVTFVNPGSASLATYTAPSGYTLDCSQTATSPTSYGVAIAHKFVATAGAGVGGGTGTLAVSDAWGVFDFGFQPLSNGAY